ncbi:HEPN domain-containing protein [Methylorubrum extorquens]|uniref:HEPN domain-containing protein n=1 Tax=Methylorubrum extorquens TaxID=408 RepID=UPI0035CEFEA4
MKSALEEFIEYLASKATRSDHLQLPSGMNQTNDLNYVEWIIRESRWQNSRKHGEVQRAAALISASKFIPEAFSRKKSNPGIDTVKILLKDYGIKSPFEKINKNLEKFFVKFPEHNDAESLLTSIVTKRNQIAHGVTSLNISRSELNLWVEFMSSFTRAIDKCLNEHTFSIIGKL